MSRFHIELSAPNTFTKPVMATARVQTLVARTPDPEDPTYEAVAILRRTTVEATDFYPHDVHWTYLSRRHA